MHRLDPYPRDVPELHGLGFGRRARPDSPESNIALWDKAIALTKQFVAARGPKKRDGKGRIIGGIFTPQQKSQLHAIQRYLFPPRGIQMTERAWKTGYPVYNIAETFRPVFLLPGVIPKLREWELEALRGVQPPYPYILAEIEVRRVAAERKREKKKAKKKRQIMTKFEKAVHKIPVKDIMLFAASALPGGQVIATAAETVMALDEAKQAQRQAEREGKRAEALEAAEAAEAARYAAEEARYAALEKADAAGNLPGYDEPYLSWITRVAPEARLALKQLYPA